MPSLTLHTSNRLEILAEKLAQALRPAPPDPFARETVVVQSKGMERWVSLQLASAFGIWCNYTFPFPNAMVREACAAFLPDPDGDDPYDRETMAGEIMGLLPGLLDCPEFSSVRRFTGEVPDQLKLFQVSARIADCFDQYLLYRPGMILDWEAGRLSEGVLHRKDAWQPRLWQELRARLGPRHRAALHQRFLQTLEGCRERPAGFPERISVFGISSLPLLHLEALAALGAVCDVNFFLLNPCREFWQEVRSRREMVRLEQRSGHTREELRLEEGNALLASWGRTGREFYENLLTGAGQEGRAEFADPGEGSLLHLLQTDILTLHDRAQTKARDPAPGDDETLQIHSCHNPRREVEVLHDYLLRRLETNPGLEPREIVVMAPDIETYVPYIHAVFSAPIGTNRLIPFSIADRSLKRESRVADAFLRILNLPLGRFSASEVFSLLEEPAVQNKFNLRPEDREDLRSWIQNSQVRWGYDETDKTRLGLPALRQNTWRAGLDRMLLGYALPGRGENLFQDILPYDDIEGSGAFRAGALADFVTSLHHTAAELEENRPLSAWPEVLERILDTFFAPDRENSAELDMIRREIRRLAERGKRAESAEPLGLPVMVSILTQAFTEKGFGGGFLSGGVTFCSMLPMRSIPFRVIALLGLNDSSFPRRQKFIGFDLIPQRPRTGDRNRSNDDRYLFLETLLSAREHLFLSYCGQSDRDNQVIPPSIILSELLDYLDRGFGPDLRKRICIRHRLQGFSPDYYTGSGPGSYSPENHAAAVTLLRRRNHPEPAESAPPFFPQPLPPPEPEFRTVEIRDLCRFFRNPAKFLLQVRLKLYLEETAARLEDQERFRLEGRERYLLAESLVQAGLSGAGETDFPVKNAAGLLPHGNPGRFAYGQLQSGAGYFARQIRRLWTGPELAPLYMDLALDGFRVRGTVGGLREGKRFQYRYAKLRATDRLETWILHLILQSSGSYYSTLVGRDQILEFIPPAQSAALLKQLLDAYWEGLSQPLPFFPETSFAYVQKMASPDKPEEIILAGVENSWRAEEKEYSQAGEWHDPYVHRCFGHRPQLPAEFAGLASRIWTPLLGHCREVQP